MPILLVALLLVLFQQAPQSPKPVLLLNGTVHLGDGTTIPNAALAIASDSISLLGDARMLRIDKAYYEIVDAFSLHIYPGQVVVHPSLVGEPTETGNLPVLLDSGLVLVPQLHTGEGYQLQEGAPATLLVTDIALTADTQPHVRYAFVKGRAVALPDSSAHHCAH